MPICRQICRQAQELQEPHPPGLPGAIYGVLRQWGAHNVTMGAAQGFMPSVGYFMLFQ